MSKKYTIDYAFKAKIRVEVEGDFPSEGHALENGRLIAEDADINEFVLGEECDSQIIDISGD